MRRALAAFAAASLLLWPGRPDAGTADGARSVAQVQRSVNAWITYDSSEPYGARWVPAGDQGWRGDCEDYALEKLRRLSPADRRGAAVWLVTAEEGSLHAVLVLQGGTVLDNRRYDPVHRSALEADGYTFICAVRDLSPAPGSDRARCNRRS